ncbi:hypothetical protein IJG73_00505 [Candidatus Saccharibacteria bacterium]|nr:hypothetical protein [Candidatus Saccharibacteria bacterium]
MREYDAGKMFTFLRGFCAGGNYPGVEKALGFMRDKHAGQYRKTSHQPYIVHPLSMACYATGITGCKEDDLLAAILLHDVPEDAGVPINSLPCSDAAKKAVRFMTFTQLPGEPKEVAKARYFCELLECRRATIIKGLDRFDNLSTMQEMLALSSENEQTEKSERSIVKNVYETHFLLLPVLKEAKEKWPDFAGTFHVLRYNLRALNTTLAYAHGINLYSVNNKIESLAEGTEKYQSYAKADFPAL